MSIATTLLEIREMHKLPFPTRLSVVVAEIAEVYPYAPSTGGSRQQIRIIQPGPFAMAVDVQLFDQQAAIPMSASGSVIRISANPDAARALVWERSKASKPSTPRGTLVVRSQARMEVFPKASIAMAGITAFGAMVATTTPAADPAPASPGRDSARPAALVAASIPSVPASGREADVMMRIAQDFGECLGVARKVLGPEADPEDVRATARVIYEESARRRAMGTAA